MERSTMANKRKRSIVPSEQQQKRKKKIGKSKLRNVIYIPGFLEKLEAEQTQTVRSVCKQWRTEAIAASAWPKSPTDTVISSGFILNFDVGVVSVRSAEGRIQKYDLPQRLMGLHVQANAPSGLIPAECFFIHHRQEAGAQPTYVINPHVKMGIRIPHFDFSSPYPIHHLSFTGMHFDASEGVLTYLAGRYSEGSVTLQRYDTQTKAWSSRRIETDVKPKNDAVCSWGSFFWLDKQDDLLVGYDIANEELSTIRLPVPPIRDWKIGNQYFTIEEVSYLNRDEEWHLKGCDGCIVLLHTPFTTSHTNLGANAAWELEKSDKGDYAWANLAISFGDGADGEMEDRRRFLKSSISYNVDRNGWWLVVPNHVDWSGRMLNPPNRVGESMSVFDNVGKLRHRIPVTDVGSVLGRAIPCLDSVDSFEINKISWPRY